MTRQAPLLEIKHLTTSYRIDKIFCLRKKVKVLDDINFSLEAGEILAVTGDAGSGKSTLLRIINGNIQNVKGEILYFGKPLNDYERIDRVNFVRMFYSQAENSINPYIKVEKILNTPLELNTKLTSEMRKNRIDAILNYVGLSLGVKECFPIMLNHIQLLRLSLAKALILHPKILLVDAVVERLDLQLRAQIINILLDQQKKYNTTIIICLNNLDLINHMADKMLILDHGQQAEFNNVTNILISPQSDIGKRILQCDRNEYRTIVSH